MENATKSARFKLRISRSLRNTLVPLQKELLTIGVDMCEVGSGYEGDVDWFDAKCEEFNIPIQNEDILFQFSKKVQWVCAKQERQETEKARILAFKDFLEKCYPAIASRLV